VTVIQLPVRHAARLGAVALVAAAALAACGGSGTAGATSTSAATSAASANGTAGAGRFDTAELQKIRECLAAAGISLPTPTGTRTFNPSDRPTNRPSGSPTGARADGFGREFADPKVRAALDACGITLPTARPGFTGGSPAPTATG
jgi:hypothetical protein